MRYIFSIVTIVLLGSGTVFGYVDNADNTITDSRFGLMWQKQDDGTPRTWEDAITYCEGLTLAGWSDWRMPNIKELKSIVVNTRYNPAINPTYFPNTVSNFYYSSTTFVNNPDWIWGVNFIDGEVNTQPKTGLYVRCVRGGN